MNSQKRQAEEELTSPRAKKATRLSGVIRDPTAEHISDSTRNLGPDIQTASTSALPIRRPNTTSTEPSGGPSGSRPSFASPRTDGAQPERYLFDIDASVSRILNGVAEYLDNECEHGQNVTETSREFMSDIASNLRRSAKVQGTSSHGGFQTFQATSGGHDPARVVSLSKKLENEGKRKLGSQKVSEPKHIPHYQVAAEKEKLEGELMNDLYTLKKRQGYGGDFETFRGYMAYRNLIDTTIRTGDVISPARSFSNLREAAQSGEANRRRPANLQDYLRKVISRAQRAGDSATTSPSHPFTPTAEQLKALQKKKEAETHRQPHPVTTIPTDMSKSEEDEVRGVLRKKDFIVKCGREHVSASDLAGLKPGHWVNDQVINFYGQMILSRSESHKETTGNKSQKPLNVHYFNTFFWPKLNQHGYHKGQLAKWTKKVDIFSKDAILIPMYLGKAGWAVAAINFRKKRIEFYDSAGIRRQHIYGQLRQYLNSEHQDKKKKPFDFTGWEDYWMEDLPLQENLNDCGVFTCQYIESMSRGVEQFPFQQKHMPYLRKRMILEIAHLKLHCDTS